VRHRRSGWALTILALTAALVLWHGTAGSRAAYTAAVTNSTDTTKMGYIRCIDAGHAYGARRLYPLGDVSLITATDFGTDGAVGTYQVTHTLSATKACSNDSTGSTVLNGLTQWVSTATTLSVTASSDVTEAIWFSTTVNQGVLLSIGDSALGVSTVKGLELFLNAAGKLVFGTNDGTTNHEIVSPSAYTDGAWHLAVAVYASGGTTRLYVDGRLVASTGTGAAPTQNLTNCYLHIGFDTTAGFANGSLSALTYHFSGSVAFAELYGTALTAQQVSDLYLAA
jgi:Concanavalin A-like lectin/glucanases superfamily